MYVWCLGIFVCICVCHLCMLFVHVIYVCYIYVMYVFHVCMYVCMYVCMHACTQVCIACQWLGHARQTIKSIWSQIRLCLLTMRWDVFVKLWSRSKHMYLIRPLSFVQIAQLFEQHFHTDGQWHARLGKYFPGWYWIIQPVLFFVAAAGFFACCQDVVIGQHPLLRSLLWQSPGQSLLLESDGALLVSGLLLMCSDAQNVQWWL